MITVHHLNNSRSQRILWFLEELAVPYQITKYERDAETNLAPDTLKAVHPLGKSPVIEDNTKVIAESGTIIDYLADHHGGGKWKPTFGSDLYTEYSHWLHFAEGSAMLPLLLMLYTSRLGEAATPLMPRIQSEIGNHLSYLDAALDGKKWLLDDISAADIQMSFVAEASIPMHNMFPNIAAYKDRFQARPAYKAALEKGGEYRFA